MVQETATPEPTSAPQRPPGEVGEQSSRGFLRRIASVFDFSALDFSVRDLWPGERGRAAQRRADLSALCREAYEKRGKIAGLMATAAVADAYRQLDETGRDAFFAMLRDEFSLDQAELRAAIAAYGGAVDADPAGDPDSGAHRAAGAAAGAIVRLSRAMESPRLVLFEQFNTIPAGIKFLVDLRADLAGRLARDPSLAPLEYELHRKLASFFNLGFLQLERIGWESPAALLENLIRYQSVHHISNWDDLKHRLISDRACYAFLHPAMPCEPVIFVEVALVQGLAENIQQLLDPAAPDLSPEQADTAIFYGISNAQRGLRGIPFGNLLIKKVVTRLRGEYPNLSTFATLSPLPRLRADYLDAAIADGTLAHWYEKAEAERLCTVAQAPDAASALRELLAEPEWNRNEDMAEALRPGLLRAARDYLTERRHNGHAACPVAHFHGSNGALLTRIDWLGDTSPQGMAQSAGIMANYLYDMDRFERQQSDYLQGGSIATAKDVRGL